MSFNSNPSRVEYVVTSSITKTYTFNFAIFNETDLIVYKVPSGVLPDDKAHLLTLSSDYTVTINGEDGGFVNFINDLSTDDTIIIQRNLPIDRKYDYVNNGGIYSDILNADQDYQTYMLQDINLTSERFLQLPKTIVGFDPTLPSPLPNALLTIDATGKGFEFNTDLGERARIVSENIDSVNVAADNISTISTLSTNITDINSVVANLTNINLAAQYADEIQDNRDYIQNAREAMMDPTGYNHEIPAEQGIMELCVVDPDDSTQFIIYGIDQNRNAIPTRIIPKTNSKWYNGSPIDTSKDYQFAQMPFGSTPISWWIAGQKYTSETIDVIELLPQSGPQFIYRDENGLGISAGVGRELFIETAYTAYVYGNYTDGRKVVFADERHGINISGGTHYMMHFTQGFKYIDGYDLVGIAAGSNTYSHFEPGKSFDEDIERNTGVITASICQYIEGTHWTGCTYADTNLGIIPDGFTRVAYNQFDGNVWKLTEVDPLSYTLTHFFLTNDAEYPIVKILGQAQYNDITTAQEAALTELKTMYKNNLPTIESTALFTIIIDSNGNLVVTDTGKLRTDWRTSDIVGSQTSGDLLPNQTGKDNYILQTTGSLVKWADINSIAGGTQVDEEFVVPDDTAYEFNVELTTGSVTKSADRISYETQAGEYKDFAMENPKGRWLFCNGREISRTEYADLFEAIGTTYGDGDGITTFNIPDLRGVFKRTVDAGKGFDYQPYRPLGSYQKDVVKEHRHYIGHWRGIGAAGTNRAMLYLGGSDSEIITTDQYDKYNNAYNRKYQEFAEENTVKNVSVYTCIRY